MACAHHARGLVRRGALDVAGALVPVDAWRPASNPGQSGIRAQRAGYVAIESDVGHPGPVLAMPGGGCADRLATSAPAPGRRGPDRRAHRLGVVCAAASGRAHVVRVAGAGRAHTLAHRPPPGIPRDRESPGPGSIQGSAPGAVDAVDAVDVEADPRPCLT